MTEQSTAAPVRRKSAKSPKPKPRFPLWRHAGSGQWAKKFRGRVVYFGSVKNDPTGSAAQDEYERQRKYLEAGETPPPASVDISRGCTLKALCNHFLDSKNELLQAGDLSPHTFRGHHQTCAALIEFIGRDRLVGDLRPDDFKNYRTALRKRGLGVVSRKNAIIRARVVFNHAHENNLIDRPVRYGSEFDPPSAKVLRNDRNQAGPKLFERDELLTILNALDGQPIAVEGEDDPVTLTADPQLKAMVLLGLNCGFGNTDVANLPQSAIKDGWVTFARLKTGTPRRIPLWPETSAALKVAIDKRPTPAEPSVEGLCFLTRCGAQWVRTQQPKEKQTEAEDAPTKPDISIDSLAQQFSKLLHKLKINGRKGLGYYTLRHCFETQAGESTDQVAVNSIMGHVDTSMAANYRHRISDERLRAVVNVVRDWLLSPEVNEKGGAA